MTKLTHKLEPLFQKGHFPEAIEALKVGANELKTWPLYEDAKLVLDKIQANILLSSKTATPQDFEPLISRGLLNASPASENEGIQIPPGLLVSTVVKEAAEALASTGIQCLDVRSNSRLCKLPVEALCKIPGLRELECADCLLLESPPPELAKEGGASAMTFVRECVKQGQVNESLSLFFVGGGECGKTSIKRALVNEESNIAPPIDTDTRTVGMDLEDWSTKDNA